MLQNKGLLVKTVLNTDIFGRPFSCFKGSDGDDDAGTGGGDTGGAGDDDGDGDDPNAVDKDGLTAGGRKLIEQEREAAKTAKRAYGPWRKLERDFGLSVDEVRARLEGKVDDGKGNTTDVDTIRREAEVAATKKVNARLVRAEVKALATATFADPEDAHLFLDLDDIDVDDDGEVDTKAIETALKDVLRRKPHLAKVTKTDGDDDMEDLDGGARRTSTKPLSMMDVIRQARDQKMGASR